MALSAFDIYSIGIGPSSSHTVGPMRAARRFVDLLHADGHLLRVSRLQAELFGSLGATGHGHGSPLAVLLGLEGEDPATVDTSCSVERFANAKAGGVIKVAGIHSIAFDPDTDIVLHRRRSLPAHPNGMTFTAYDDAGEQIRTQTYYSVGGGFVIDESAVGADRVVLDSTAVRFPFNTGHELLDICRREGLAVSDVVWQNELSWRSPEDIRAGLLNLWSVMVDCVEAGCRSVGVLPGGLKVERRAPALFRDLSARSGSHDPLAVMDWVNLFAIAVNEENASGGRVVTAPTNGAAGIVPAVLHYYARFIPDANEDGIVRMLLTAAAIAVLFKENASISGAEVGCQGEVGAACSMAAAALCEVLGGTPEQVENAAEIGIEHNLGLTCDPVGGLVQIPCIERNAIGAVKAINAARLSLHGNGHHKVSLDAAIRTMRDTGRDMHVKYKETSRGGLAVNVIEC
jgi:L-serine dehydratase